MMFTGLDSKSFFSSASERCAHAPEGTSSDSAITAAKRPPKTRSDRLFLFNASENMKTSFAMLVYVKTALINQPTG